jgi:catechol-2,3-dioxygenase
VPAADTIAPCTSGVLDGSNVTRRETAPIPIAGIAHIGIRVHDLERSVAFYELLGFRKTAGPIGGPIRFETGAQAIFVRDPDRNVIELDQRG